MEKDLGRVQREAHEARTRGEALDVELEKIDATLRQSKNDNAQAPTNNTMNNSHIYDSFLSNGEFGIRRIGGDEELLSSSLKCTREGHH